MTPPVPTTPPATEYFNSMSRSVSSPLENSKIMAAMFENACSMMEMGSPPETGKNPAGKPGRGIAPSAKGPMRMPAISSPSTEGREIAFAAMPPMRAAKMITAS